MGPTVPATRGMPVEPNHHRLHRRRRQQRPSHPAGREAHSPWFGVVPLGLLGLLGLLLVFGIVVFRVVDGLDMLVDGGVQVVVVHRST